MKLKTLRNSTFVVALALSNLVSAAESIEHESIDAAMNSQTTPRCVGTVVDVLDWPSKCGGKLAFRLDSSLGKWICPLSDASVSMALSAWATGKPVFVRLNNSTNPDALDCSTMNQYHVPLYIVGQR